ncbi:hypothetical protein CASFOL_042995 [Castilleja foliolosa]|uniref:WRKY domain-containing protein n=1 Tax=Castilleja foliolosa TaxID=1961234 RepID=A0ABD3B713_9LAMI
MEMNNPFTTTTPIFQSTTLKNSHTNLLMNMLASNYSDHHRQIFLQDDQIMINNNNNNSYNMSSITETPIRSSTASTMINYSTARDDHIDEAKAGAAGKIKKAGDNNKYYCRKPKYAFQTRSQVDILDDGYRWRKYGQKAVKNNKFPRSYYRCTHQGCNVKKQIQRLSKDESVVVTTYEGMHSHPIDKSTDNFEHILTQMQIYTSY